MAITIIEAYKQLQKALLVQNISTPQDPWWLLEFIVNHPYDYLLLHKQKNLSIDEQEILQEVIHKIAAHMPIAYIIGNIPFLNLQLDIKPPILIARPETEYWVSELITKIKSAKIDHIRILDMCTGSGCIGLSLAQSFPKSHVVAVDINPIACELARLNALKNEITNIEVIESNLFEDVPYDSFDLIVSNPPYIAPSEFENLDSSVKLWEDTHALVAQDNGLEIIKKIGKKAHSMLQNSTLKNSSIPPLWMEIGHLQGPMVREILLKQGFRSAEIFKDLSAKDRVVFATV